jgi:predicted lipase
LGEQYRAVSSSLYKYSNCNNLKALEDQVRTFKRKLRMTTMMSPATLLRDFPFETCCRYLKGLIFVEEMVPEV